MSKQQPVYEDIEVEHETVRARQLQRGERICEGDVYVGRWLTAKCTARDAGGFVGGASLREYNGARFYRPDFLDNAPTQE
jgi:hypothetical protein